MNTGLAMEFAGTYDNVNLTGGCITAICRYAAFSDKDSGLITNGVVEALNNIIEHACKGREDGEIRLIVDVESDRLVFNVRYRGTFPDSLIKPKLDFDPEDIENLPEGGMGLYIIYKVMDSISYEPQDKETLMTMIKYRTKSPVGAGT